MTDIEESQQPLLPQPINENEVKNKDYKIRNLLSFNFTGFFCIALVIFLTSTQPFYITQILDIDNKKIGKIIGSLGVADELACIVSAPLIGSLNDRLLHSNFVLGSTKFIVFLGFVSIFISFYLYGLVDFSLWYQLIIPRVLFALGVTSNMSMVPVLLHQLIYSDFKFSSIFFWKEPETSAVSNIKKNGRYSALIGVSIGLGAVFSVSVFLPLPVRLLVDYDLSSKVGLKLAFIILGTCSLLASFILLKFLYNNEKDDRVVRPGYLSLLKTGFSKTRANPKIRFACIGGGVARSTSVLIAVFIPLFVYNFYFKSGICDNDGSPAEVSCYDGYTFAAILTGVAQTISLLTSPFWGVIADKFGKKNTLLLASAVSLVGTWTTCILNIFDPRSVTTFVLMSIIGASQIGIAITSMSIISAENDTVGSVSGVYNLFGGAGILILSQLGGVWSDHWILAPFFLVGLFDIILIGVGLYSK